MAVHSHETGRDPRLDLQLWFLESLHPKLVRAADAGVVRPAAAAELERQVTELLDLRLDDLDEAA